MRSLFKTFALIGLSLSLGLFSGLGSGALMGCGSLAANGTVNEHFEDVSPNPTDPTTAIDPSDADQVTVVEPGVENGGAQIGTIADVETSRVLCVILDPAAGDFADLEVCEADRINTETQSADGLCPEADRPSRCASRNGGSGPDYCEVTGANDYAFVILNLSGKNATVAYQVIDRPCGDLEITEDSILSDE